jgi:hypothetical protein
MKKYTDDGPIALTYADDIKTVLEIREKIDELGLTEFRKEYNYICANPDLYTEMVDCNMVDKFYIQVENKPDEYNPLGAEYENGGFLISSEYIAKGYIHQEFLEQVLIHQVQEKKCLEGSVK